MFSNPTNDEIAIGLADFLDGGSTVSAFVIGQYGVLGRADVVVTENAIDIVTLKWSKAAGANRLPATRSKSSR